MITPDPFGTIRRAPRRAVRKYDLTELVIGAKNRSTSRSTSGMPRIPGVRDPDRVEGYVDAAYLLDHGPEVVVHSPLVECVHLRRLGGSAVGDDLLGDDLHG